LVLRYLVALNSQIRVRVAWRQDHWPLRACFLLDLGLSEKNLSDLVSHTAAAAYSRSDTSLEGVFFAGYSKGRDQCHPA